MGQAVKTVYLAGKMSGVPEWNFPAFNAKAEHLRELGWHVENPADNGLTEGYRWQDYMREALAQLVKCDYIYLLAGWETSRGAQLELHVAKQLGMTVMLEDFGNYAP